MVRPTNTGQICDLSTVVNVTSKNLTQTIPKIKPRFIIKNTNGISIACSVLKIQSKSLSINLNEQLSDKILCSHYSLGFRLSQT